MKRFYTVMVCVLTMLMLATFVGCGKESESGEISSGTKNTSSTGEEAIGGDWRVQRGYSEDLALTDDLTVCFASFDDGTGYGVYDSSSGGRIGSLVLTETGYGSGFVDSFQRGDCNGDGTTDIGLVIDDKVLWYGYNPENSGWSESNPTGGFYLIQ